MNDTKVLKIKEVLAILRITPNEDTVLYKALENLWHDGVGVGYKEGYDDGMDDAYEGPMPEWDEPLT